MLSPTTTYSTSSLPDHTPSRLLATGVLLDMMRSNPVQVEVEIMVDSSSSKKKRKHNNENTEPNTSTTPKTSYSRASKSLGLLTLSFLSLSSGDNSRIISVDKSAVRLGVERRRVYDVVNILSSLSILVRVGKNTYENLGTSNLPQKLLQMKYQEIKFRGGDYGKWVREGVIREEEIQEVKEAGVREELKSLGSLLRQFLVLFLLSPPSSSFTLSTAASLVLGANGESEKGGKTKVRRLYDIANVCCSLGIVEKGGERKNEFRLC
mmetsp:Transcript_19366/g.35969  ORF Transcript_19366/g.35969 Transcript_19366/m.35969 type:complete len:265 (+) Transcript_19366:56-850(+)